MEVRRLRLHAAQVEHRQARTGSNNVSALPWRFPMGPIMTDAYLMDADCIHGKTWWECDECEEAERADLPPSDGSLP